MTVASQPPSSDTPRKTLAEKIVHEIRETVVTIAVFVPFWLVFSTFVYELRSIPSESMVPALQVGDRVAVAKFAYGYDRNSVPFGLGRLFIGDDEDDPDNRIFGRTPERGDVAVFQHPSSDKVMIKRIIGLPGDTVQVVNGRLLINGEEVGREPVRRTTYIQIDALGMMRTAEEYVEKLPGQKGEHLIHEFSDNECLDRTPIFRVPAKHVFMMGDNRDNSEDSRAASGHPGLAAAFPEAWSCRAFAGGEKAVGFVPFDHLIGRAETVLFTLHACRRAEGSECPRPRLWKGL
jgi:signal peptidase I